MTTPVVRLRDAQFGYRARSRHALDLQIAAGEVVAVLGANGSGKSTLVKGMLGLVDCYGGEVEWFGSRLGGFGDRWRVGYVPQHQLVASPIPVTVEELVRSGRVARTGVLGRYRAADRRAVGEAIDTVGLADQRRVPVGQLSGGQQRRALVGRGLAGGPDALVLDEPFAGVDRENQQALAATFTALAARGATLVVVLHELGPLTTIVTRIVSLAAGAVVHDGPPGDAPAEVAATHGDVDPHGGTPEIVPRLGLFSLVTAVVQFLDYDFMRRALVAALFVGLSAPAVGIFLVQRRLALIGDGVGHVAVTGVALGLVLDRAPLVVATMTAVAGAVAIEVIRARVEAFAEVALAILFYGGIAGGVVLASQAPAGGRSLGQYLFGSITTTSMTDLATFAVLAALIIAITTSIGPALFAVSNDEEFARASGLPVLGLNIGLAVLCALTVVISMRVVGVLLISALMVVPVATAQLLTRSFRATYLVGVLLGALVAVTGVIASYYLDTPSGGTIVLIAIGLFAVVLIGEALRSQHRRR